jgi:hypothetical protein
VSGQLHTPADFPPGKEPPPYPMGRRLGEPQSRSARRGEEKNLALPGMEPGHSIPQPVAILTELTTPPCSAEVKKGGAIPPLPNMSSWPSA